MAARHEAARRMVGDRRGLAGPIPPGAAPQQFGGTDFQRSGDGQQFRPSENWCQRIVVGLPAPLTLCSRGKNSNPTSGSTLALKKEFFPHAYRRGFCILRCGMREKLQPGAPRRFVATRRAPRQMRASPHQCARWARSDEPTGAAELKRFSLLHDRPNVLERWGISPPCAVISSAGLHVIGPGRVFVRSAAGLAGALLATAPGGGTSVSLLRPAWSVKNQTYEKRRLYK